VKKSLKYIIPTAAITAVAMFSMVGSVSAQSNKTPLCVLEGLPLSEFHKSFTVKGDKVTAKFTLKGEENCKFDMTLATFETPSADATPFKEQKLYSSVSSRFGRGTHTLTTNMPDCFYQVDILTGKPSEAVKGTRLFDFMNRVNFTNLDQFRTGTEAAHVHDALIGGDKSCEKPVIPEPEKPGGGETVEQTKPEAPAVESAVTTKQPEVLPSTGPAAIASTFAGVTASAGLAHAIVRRFRR